MIEAVKKVNLCDSCVHEFAICEALNVKYGTGVGNDNVISCDCYEEKPTSTKTPNPKLVYKNGVTL